MKHLTLITVLFSILLISCDPEDIIGNLGGNGNGNTEYDCPELMLNFDDPCVGFDEETGIPYNGIVNGDCDCINLEDIEWDCPEIYANIGDPCIGFEEGSDMPYSGIVDENCDCVRE